MPRVEKVQNKNQPKGNVDKADREILKELNKIRKQKGTKG